MSLGEGVATEPLRGLDTLRRRISYLLKPLGPRALPNSLRECWHAIRSAKHMGLPAASALREVREPHTCAGLGGFRLTLLGLQLEPARPPFSSAAAPPIETRTE